MFECSESWKSGLDFSMSVWFAVWLFCVLFWLSFQGSREGSLGMTILLTVLRLRVRLCAQLRRGSIVFWPALPSWTHFLSLYSLHV